MRMRGVSHTLTSCPFFRNTSLVAVAVGLYTERRAAGPLPDSPHRVDWNAPA